MAPFPWTSPAYFQNFGFSDLYTRLSLSKLAEHGQTLDECESFITEEPEQFHVSHFFPADSVTVHYNPWTFPVSFPHLGISRRFGTAASPSPVWLSPFISLVQVEPLLNPFVPLIMFFCGPLAPALNLQGAPICTTYSFFPCRPPTHLLGLRHALEKFSLGSPCFVSILPSSSQTPPFWFCLRLPWTNIRRFLSRPDWSWRTSCSPP